MLLCHTYLHHTLRGRNVINMIEMLLKCKLCPRNCEVNRLKGEIGYCRSTLMPSVARVSLHKWEEPCISGKNGSGTVFFSNCNLNCVFCQNHEISQENTGLEITIERLSEIFIEVQTMGAHNVNLVTPVQYIPQIIEAIILAKKKGLIIPILFNTNGYENIEAIKALSGFVDVYLPDMKYFSNKYSKLYSNAPDYFKFASSSINEMVSQVGPVKFNKDGLIKSGVIIRHLVLPGLLFDSKKIIDYIFKTFGDSVYLSIMNQYTPLYKANMYPKLSNPLNPKVYDTLIEIGRAHV
jgi:putative pyruvate formate lyase activating enzyme